MGLGYDSSADAKLSGQISVRKWENIQPGRRNGEVTPSESMQRLRLIWSELIRSLTATCRFWYCHKPSCLLRQGHQILRPDLLIPRVVIVITHQSPRKKKAWKWKERRAIDVRMLCFVGWKKVAENWSVCILFCWRLAWLGASCKPHACSLLGDGETLGQ